MPAARKKKKKAKKKVTKKKVKPDDPRLAEVDNAIREYCDLANRADAIEDLMSVRKKRVDILMSDMGLSRQDIDGIGGAKYSERRTFKVRDEERLSELMPKRQLAALAKVTADVYDAAVAEKVAIDEAVAVGRSPSLSISRSRTKLAKERQKKHIAASRKAAEERVEANRAEWRKNKRA